MLHTTPRAAIFATSLCLSSQLLAQQTVPVADSSPDGPPLNLSLNRDAATPAALAPQAPAPRNDAVHAPYGTGFEARHPGLVGSGFGGHGGSYGRSQGSGGGFIGGRGGGRGR